MQRVAGCLEEILAGRVDTRLLGRNRVNDPSWVEIGVVVGAHALRGEVRVRYFGDGPDHLLDSEHVWLGEHRNDRAAVRYGVIGGGTGRGGEVRLALEGVTDRNAAEALRGRFVLLDRDDLETLGDDEFYWHELIGCTVATDTGREIGVVRALWDSGRHDVLVVVGADGQQILIPTAREIMTHVDRPARRIVVQDVPGLISPAVESPGGDRDAE